VQLAFPYELVKYGQNAEGWNGQENCTLRAGEEDIDYTLHYSYRASGGFNASSCVEQYLKTDEFFTPDLTVTKYVYKITFAEDDGDAFVKVYLGGDARSKIVRGDDSISSFVENGYRCLGYRVSAAKNEIVYYAIGGENEAERMFYGKRERGLSAAGELPFEIMSNNRNSLFPPSRKNIATTVFLRATGIVRRSISLTTTSTAAYCRRSRCAGTARSCAGISIRSICPRGAWRNIPSTRRSIPQARPRQIVLPISFHLFRDSAVAAGWKSC